MPKKKKKTNNNNNNSNEGCISILTPTYNRSKFLPLITYNIKSQSYDHNKLSPILNRTFFFIKHFLIVMKIYSIN